MPNESSSSEPGHPAGVGAVSFLNAKPLVAGLRDDPSVRVAYAVPSKLLGMLRDGRVVVALVPVVDLTSVPRLRAVSDACIASDGETLTVRVFSRVPPSRIGRLQVDGDSHTSVILARLMWRELFGRTPTTSPLTSLAEVRPDDGVLLIGDKVVSARPRGFAFEVEMLCLAQAYGYKIREMPVRLLYEGSPSSVRLIKDSLRMCWSLGKIWSNQRQGVYGKPSC